VLVSGVLTGGCVLYPPQSTPSLLPDGIVFTELVHSRIVGYPETIQRCATRPSRIQPGICATRARRHGAFYRGPRFPLARLGSQRSCSPVSPFPAGPESAILGLLVNRMTPTPPLHGRPSKQRACKMGITQVVEKKGRCATVFWAILALSIETMTPSPTRYGFHKC
jgi:hypothetical protein